MKQDKPNKPEPNRRALDVLEKFRGQKAAGKLNPLKNQRRPKK